jgi:hypothetical protein
MQNQFVITIDSKVTPDFALSFLKSINFLKAIRPRKEKDKEKTDIEDVTLMYEKSLSEEWLSEEDTRWDKVL